MNKVASHINEMQKIHEEYGAVFDQLIAEQTGEKKEVTDDQIEENQAVILVPVAWMFKLYQIFIFCAVSFKWIVVQTDKSQSN